MMCMTELHGGVCHPTSTPHKSGNKMKEKKRCLCPSSSSFVRQLSYFQAGRCQPDPGVLVEVGQAPLSIRWPVHCAVVHDVLHRLVWRTTFAFRGGF